ncbi:CHD domain containing protein [Rhabdaerophilaceae bacterium]
MPPTKIDALTAAEPPAPFAERWHLSRWPRVLRLWSGSIIFVFLTVHLLNIAFGIFGLELLDKLQALRWKIQMKPITLTLIYGAFLVHITLGLARIAARKTFRMPLDEALQIVTGLVIPLLLLPHLLHTRIAHDWLGGNGFYGTVLWTHFPAKIWMQTALVIVAWTHGVIGLHMAFRHRPWYPFLRRPAAILALLIPTLAMAGFVSAGREVRKGPAPTAIAVETRMSELQTIGGAAYLGIGGVFFLLVGLLNVQYVKRRIGRKIIVDYRGRGPVKVARGLSVLDASRINHVPHPSLCRGKGRCSTCRVQVLSKLSELPEASALERSTLERVGAPAHVRLACQLRPDHDISVRILLPVLGRVVDRDERREAERWAIEQTATVLALDLFAFNVLVRSQVPYELAALLNRFSLEMRQAVENHGGKVVAFHGEGLIAVFDVLENERAGARQALEAARDMTRVLKIINKEMGSALPIPIRAGIGIHTGLVTLARIGETESDAVQMAFGAAVDAAIGLKMATRTALIDCLVSVTTIQLAQLDATGLKTLEVAVPGAGETISAVGVTNLNATRRWRIQQPENAEV